MQTLEFGLDTFLPVTVDGAGLPISGDQVIRNTVQEAVVAETVGIDSFNIGEHYRREFDPVDTGPLTSGSALEPDGSPIAATYSADQLSQLISLRTGRG